ncbi:MAG: chloride channel protein [Nostocaceae cyanobacterium]|nr:chloride channel protein [Nostocaceae cyanobacterium]
MWHPHITQQLRQWWQPRQRLAIVEACVIGLVAALSAVALQQGSGWLGTWRVHASHMLPVGIALPVFGMVFGYLAGLLVERFAPEASGSGVPQVKANLANVPVQLSWRVGLVKLLGSIIALGSGITLGRQGPTVQVGAALAAAMMRWVPTSPDHRRQIIAAGAGAGLAAAFNAPIAGVLFVVEELLQDLSELTLGTAIIASFIGGVVSRLLGGRSLDLNLESSRYHSSFSLPELPFFLLLGILAGVLASLFTRGLVKSVKVYRLLHVSLPVRVAIAGLLSGVIVAMLPLEFRDNTGLREFVLVGSPKATLAAIAFVSQFILTLVAFGSGAPGGLFAPSLILGSTLGYLIGLFQVMILGVGSPTTYALAGMGAFFSAVSKVPITAIVIVFEMTTNFNLVLPLMIGSVTSYLIADRLDPGSLYDKLLKLQGITLEKETPSKGILTQLTAKDVMQPRVETLSADMNLDEVIQAFSTSHHRGFPVVEEGKLVGIVTQSDLAKIQDRNLTKYIALREIMTPQPVTVTPSQTLSNVLYLLDRQQISRLPVIDGRKLIGIITRADIIRVEADRLNGETGEKGPRPAPSYVVYQTRSASIGRGRLLVPIANPETASTLLQMAAAIARDKHYEIECLQVILVSRHTSPAESQVRTAKSRRLLRQAEVLGKKWHIPVHTQIRASHDVAQAILETIKEQHIDLMLMGWKGNTSTPGRIFGNVVDTLIRQAPCNVMLVKLATDASQRDETDKVSTTSATKSVADFNRWLIPMAGGPNAQLAIKFLPALVSLAPAPQIHLCQVFAPSNPEPDHKVMEKAFRVLMRHRQLSHSVVADAIKADSVPEGVINLAKTDHTDVVVLGASREGMLQQAIKGNIPEAIASGVNSTVILVRGAIN